MLSLRRRLFALRATAHKLARRVARFSTLPPASPTAVASISVVTERDDATTSPLAGEETSGPGPHVACVSSPAASMSVSSAFAANHTQNAHEQVKSRSLAHPRLQPVSSPHALPSTAPAPSVSSAVSPSAAGLVAQWLLSLRPSDTSVCDTSTCAAAMVVPASSTGGRGSVQFLQSMPLHAPPRKPARSVPQQARQAPSQPSTQPSTQAQHPQQSSSATPWYLSWYPHSPRQPAQPASAPRVHPHKRPRPAPGAATPAGASSGDSASVSDAMGGSSSGDGSAPGARIPVPWPFVTLLLLAVVPAVISAAAHAPALSLDDAAAAAATEHEPKTVADAVASTAAAAAAVSAHARARSNASARAGGVVSLLRALLLLPVKALRKALRVCSRTARVVVLATRFLPLLAAAAAVHYLLGPTATAPAHRWHAPLQEAVASGLCSALARSGPVFVKLAQYASTRPDVLPQSVCTRLGALREDNAPHPWADSEAAVARALGPRWEHVLRVQERDRVHPLGSGCVAQVYRGAAKEPAAAREPAAVLEDIEGSQTGSGAGSDGSDGWHEVAIKVTHPSVHSVLARDLSILRALASAAEHAPGLRSVAALLSPRQLVTEFEVLMRCQLDLRHEAANLVTLRRNFGLDPPPSAHAGPPTSAAAAAGEEEVEDDERTSSANASPNSMLQGMVALSSAPGSEPEARLSGEGFRPERALERNAAAAFAPEFPCVFAAAKGVLVERLHRGLRMAKLIEIAQADRERESDAAASATGVDASAVATLTEKKKNERETCANTGTLQQAIVEAMTPAQRAALSKEVASAGLLAFLQMLFRHGFFHADLHPGNIIVDLGYDWPPRAPAQSEAAGTAAEVGAALSMEQERAHEYGDDHAHALAHGIHTHGFVQHAHSHVRAHGLSGLEEVDDEDRDTAAGVTAITEERAAMKAYACKIVSEASAPAPEHVDLTTLALSTALYSSFHKLAVMLLPGAAVSALPAPRQPQAMGAQTALPFAPHTMFPSTVFQAIHPDDDRQHESFWKDEPLSYQAWYLTHGLPLPPRQPRLIFIDAGMCTPLSDSEMVNFRDLFYAVALNQGREAAEMMVDRAPVHPGDAPHSPEARERFVTTVSKIISEAASEGFRLSSTGVVNTLQGLLRAASEQRVRLDPAFLSVIVAVTITEGVGRSLDTNVDIVTPAIAVVAKARLDELAASIVKRNP